MEKEEKYQGIWILYFYFYSDTWLSVVHIGSVFILFKVLILSCALFEKNPLLFYLKLPWSVRHKKEECFVCPLDWSRLMWGSLCTAGGVGTARARRPGPLFYPSLSSFRFQVRGGAVCVQRAESTQRGRGGRGHISTLPSAPSGFRWGVGASVADPGCLSRIRIFFHPGSEFFPSRILDPHQRI
jgi:hypothetical protein